MDKTPKWVLLTNSYGDHHTRNYHFFDSRILAEASYTKALLNGLVPTVRPWSEKHDRPIYSLLTE